MRSPAPGELKAAVVIRLLHTRRDRPHATTDGTSWSRTSARKRERRKLRGNYLSDSCTYNCMYSHNQIMQDAVHGSVLGRSKPKSNPRESQPLKFERKKKESSQPSQCSSLKKARPSSCGWPASTILGDRNEKGQTLKQVYFCARTRDEKVSLSPISSFLREGPRTAGIHNAFRLAGRMYLPDGASQPRN